MEKIPGAHFLGGLHPVGAQNKTLISDTGLGCERSRYFSVTSHFIHPIFFFFFFFVIAFSQQRLNLHRPFDFNLHWLGPNQHHGILYIPI